MSEQNPLELENARLRAAVERLSQVIAGLRGQRRELYQVILKNDPPPRFDEQELIREKDSWIPITSVAEKVEQWMREGDVDP